MSKLLDFYFLFFIVIFRGWEDKDKASEHPLLGKCLDGTDAEKEKNALICSHYALWIFKKLRAFP